jgi:hypothetical protein
MFPTLALAAALTLAPAQNPALDISNARITFAGEFGPTRPDNKLLPGDVFFLAFDMDNLALDPMGKAQYSIGMEVNDAAGKPIYSQKPIDQDMVLPLGGNKLPARAYVTLGLDQAKGVCNCKVTVTDRVTKASKVVEKSFEVLEPAFGTVAFYSSSDERGDLPCPLGGVAGQAIWLNFFVVNFGRDPQTNAVNVTAEISVTDQAGKTGNAKPVLYTTVKTEKDTDRAIEHHIPLPMNRAGVFTVKLKTECKLTGKSYTMSFPVVVSPSPK